VITFNGATTGRWTPRSRCTFDFGDGTPIATVAATNSSCSTTHAYTATGSYTPRLSATTAYDTIPAATTGAPVVVVAPTPLTPVLSMADNGALGIYGSPTRLAWSLMSEKVDYGDGSSAMSATES